MEAPEYSRGPSEPYPGLGPGVRCPHGEHVFAVNRDVLARYTPQGEFIEEFTTPAAREELPNRRDLEEHREALRSIFRAPPNETQLREFASRPKKAFLPGPRCDDTSRLWVATSRDRDRFSYIDVFRGSTYLGSIRVRDRLLGFDVLRKALAVLVERRAREVDETDVRAIDWYTIDG